MKNKLAQLMMGLPLMGLIGTLSLVPLPAAAEPTVEAQNAPDATIAVRPFEPPVYERQPLPNELNTAEAWQTVGMNAVQVGDYPNALAAFDKAVDLSGGENPEILEQRGWLHALQGYYDEAIADLEAAANQYVTQNQYEAALNTLRMRDYVAFRQTNQTQLSTVESESIDG